VKGGTGNASRKRKGGCDVFPLLGFEWVKPAFIKEQGGGAGEKLGGGPSADKRGFSRPPQEKGDYFRRTRKRTSLEKRIGVLADSKFTKRYERSQKKGGGENER